MEMTKSSNAQMVFTFVETTTILNPDSLNRERNSKRLDHRRRITEKAKLSSRQTQPLKTNSIIEKDKLDKVAEGNLLWVSTFVKSEAT